MADFGDEGGLVFLHFVDEGLIFGAFVSAGPENHFGEHGSKVESFGSEEIDELAAVGGIGAGGDDAVTFEATQAVRENVGSGALVGVKKFFESAGAEQHHVANDEERPAIAEHFDGSVKGTPGAAFGKRLPSGHKGRVAYFHLQYASKLGQTAGTRRGDAESAGEWE